MNTESTNDCVNCLKYFVVKDGWNSEYCSEACKDEAMKERNKENKHTIGALEGFLHDLKEGESELNDLFNIIGENELRYLLKMAKIGEDALMEDSEWMEKLYVENDKIKGD